MSTRASRLLRWYRRSRRTLPWREDPSPYRVWVSELMLQQTQVKTVIPYFLRFMERFGDVSELSAAGEDDVVAAWSGLGYYRRARALHRAARQIMTERGGRFPEDVDGWMALPGVGRYTAGAIVSIAFGERAPILDGNVARVLARWFAVRGDPRKGETHRRLWELAEDVLPKRSVGDFNQALMELGALVCTPQKPKCLLCPVRGDCEAHRRGVAEELPEIARSGDVVQVRMGAAIVEDAGRFLLFRRENEGVMRGLWEFPTGECHSGESPRAALAREAETTYGLRIETSRELVRFKHSVMNRRIDFRAFAARLIEPPDGGPAPFRWLDRDEIQSVPVSSIVQKIVRSMGP